jgi:hypothetical protein
VSRLWMAKGRRLVQCANGSQDDLYGWSLGEATRLDRERDAERVSRRRLCPDSKTVPRCLSMDVSRVSSLGLWLLGCSPAVLFAGLG